MIAMLRNFKCQVYVMSSTIYYYYYYYSLETFADAKCEMNRQ